MASPLFRPSLLLLFLLIGAGTVLHSAYKEGPLCRECSVVLVSLDTVGAKHLGIYDPSLDTMPLLKKSAEERGVVFERAYAQAPWTLPSHAAMLTGRYPWDLGVVEFLDALPLSAETIAERLSQHEYRTALFSMGSFVQKEWQFDQGFDRTEGSMALADWNDVPRLFVDAASYIQEAAKTQKPFFLFVRPFEAHDPYRDGTDIHEIVAENLREGGPRTEVAEEFERGYRADLERIDQGLASLFQSLDDAGVASTTVIVITADHGEEFGEHGTAGLHGTTVYAESIHVPLIVFVPGVAARRIGATVEVRSVAPTIARIVGAGAFGPGDASALTGYLTGTRSGDQVAYARTTIPRDRHLATIEAAYAGVDRVIDGTVVPKERTAPFDGAYAESVRFGRFAAIRTMEATTELYDVLGDPDESLNLLPYLDLLSFEDRLSAAALLGSFLPSF